MQDKRIVIICGATASGKSSFAINYALKNNGVIINCDSQQVYADLKILTARPDDNDLRIVSHKLYGFLSGLQNIQNFSVIDWLNLASYEINNTFNAGRLPILVGGTGFYISALINGISIIPTISQDIRNYIRKLSNEKIYLDLKKYDPITANKLSINDTQRIMRALEVFLSTSHPLSYWQNQKKVKPFADVPFYIIYKNPNKNILLQNIINRSDEMFKNGVIDEVQQFLKLNYPVTTSIYKSIGVNEIKNYLEEGTDYDFMRNKIIIRTRQYAKRQNTWFRNQLQKNNLISEIQD